jgi:galactofuranosylgalactofuranosylrhamnosyl-N-acetylglucosaminyl-diphospho-decaprenol beta-1,5/1,6-galactofuranosyltransferase
MQVVSRVQFPNQTETSELYIKLDAGASIDFHAGGTSIMHEGNTISLNTYFNSIYEIFYTKYTTLSSLYYLLKLEGDFEVAVYREYQASTRELICSQKVQECQLSDYAKILLPELNQSQEAGRIYLEITCLSKQGMFKEGLIVTEQEKPKEISLAIITCTFKKEAYVKKTVNNILQDSYLRDKKFKVFVVDNGKTLNDSDFEDYRAKLIPNRNVGGSGGFTKGLIEALQEGVYTHFLFMDDDIELDSEAIYRLFSLYEYAKQDFAVAGSMLDLYKKHSLYEAGALYNKDFDDDGNLKQGTLALTPLKNELDLRNSTSLNLLLLEESVDYGAFWFFAFSKEVVESIGLPLPFFIKIDDIEFSLRVKKYLDNIVAFPSLAVWHEPFYVKRPVWDLYYWTRNILITESIHGSLKYFSVVKSLTFRILYRISIFDYNSAIMYVKGFNDYMEGPNFIKTNDSETLHSQIYECSKSHKTQTVQPSYMLEGYQTTKTGIIRKLVGLLTLNGHFLPRFLIKDEITPILEGTKKRDSISKGVGKKTILSLVEGSPNFYQHELDSQAGINILFTWVKSVTQNTVRHSHISAEWKKAAKELTSIKFWQDYLALNK